MNEQEKRDRINRAKQLLAEIHHVSLATVNADGSPHNSPVFMAFDDQLNGYWASHPEAQHSHNIARDGKVFMVVFDSREGHDGLFVEARAACLEQKSDALPGYQTLKVLKERFYGAMGDIEHYVDTGEQRIYCATPVRCWVNKSDRDQDGIIIRDRRHEVSIADLL